MDSVPLTERVSREWKEWRGPSFNITGCDAHYRTSSDTIRLSVGAERVEVPLRVEALNTKGEWQQFPVVFYHQATYEEVKYGKGRQVIMLPNGRYTFQNYPPYLSSQSDLYSEAERRGLTKGSLASVKVFVHEEE